MKRENGIRRIGKLLELSKATNNPHESKSAIKKAKEILDRMFPNSIPEPKSNRRLFIGG